MAVHFHEEDLATDVVFADGPIAVDTEAMGLVPGRDRLCLVQLSDGKGDEHLVRFKRGSDYSAPRLKALLSDPERLKLYHFARFDVGIMQAYLGIMAAPLYCTRTASRLIRTYTDRHGLKELVKELLNIDLSKIDKNPRNPSTVGRWERSAIVLPVTPGVQPSAAIQKFAKQQRLPQADTVQLLIKIHQ